MDKVNEQGEDNKDQNKFNIIRAAKYFMNVQHLPLSIGGLSNSL